MSAQPIGLAEVKQNISQVAVCCNNAVALRAWYQQVFDFEFAGRTIFAGSTTERVQGIQGSTNKCLWLMDSQNHFQFEFFEFYKPKSKPKAADWAVSDLGYNVLTIVVQHFDQVVERLVALNADMAVPVQGEQGARYAVAKDVEGNYLYVTEQELHSSPDAPERCDVPVTARRMTVVVPDLARATDNWHNSLGLELVADKDAPPSAFADLFEAADYQSQHVASSNFLIELVEHKHAKPRPQGYQICDIGFMNVALGLFDAEGYNRRFYHAVNNGYRANGKIADPGIFKVMYINDPDNYSVELLYARKWAWGLTGFKISTAYVENDIVINAPQDKVWEAITHHAAMGQWSVFSSTLVKAGETEENGVGAVRELSLMGSKIVEEVTEFEPQSYYAYSLRKGAPFSKHLGQLYLIPTEAGIKVRWVIRFKTKIPGTGKITAKLLQWVFGRDLKKLKQLLESA